MLNFFFEIYLCKNFFHKYEDKYYFTFINTVFKGSIQKKCTGVAKIYSAMFYGDESQKKIPQNFHKQFIFVRQVSR